MPLGERNAFIVDERGMLDRRDPRPNRVLDAFGRMRVRFDAQTEIAGLFDGGPQFLGRKLDGLRVAAMGENGARGQPSLMVMYAPATYMRGPMMMPRAIASRIATSLKAR